MKLKIINSGSVGNCYIFENATSALIVECGVAFKEVKQALNFNMRKVVGCLVTHEHLDHCKALDEVIAAGIDVYTSQGTIEASGLKSHRLHPIKSGNQFSIGDFTIMPFDVKHDAKEPLGFLIQHADCGKVLFVTDAYFVEYTFKGLNNILVEANYGREIMAKRFMAGELNGFLKDRVVQSHMSLETCKNLLKANDLKAVNNIVLIHLSDSNSDAELFKKEVRELTGKSVHVALKNTEIDFTIKPF